MYKKNTKLGSLGVPGALLIHIAEGHIGLVSNIYYQPYCDPSIIGSRNVVV